MQYDNEAKDLIEQLDKQAKEIQAKIDELKNSENKCVRWRAKYNEEFWFIDEIGGIQSLIIGKYENKSHYYYLEQFCFQVGNYFKTKEEAEKYYKNLIITQKLKDIALRLNDGKVIDWNNHDQEKWTIVIHHSDYENKLKLSTENFLELKYQGSVYCLSDKFLETAIKEIGEKELIEYIKES
jgi:hypothetical protein